MTTQKTDGLELVRKLAHNEKKERDRAVEIMQKWIANKKEISEVDMMKIWKGFWMSDKVIIQQELATKLSVMIHSFKHERAILYLNCFWNTMKREWNNLDHYRLDKFMSLCRHFLKQSFLLLEARKWKETEIFNLAMLFSGIFDEKPVPVRGLTLHILFMFVDELFVVKKLPSHAFRTLIQPLIILMTLSNEKTVHDRLQKVVFEKFIACYNEKSIKCIDLFDELAFSSQFFVDLAMDPVTSDEVRERFYTISQMITSSLASDRPQDYADFIKNLKENESIDMEDIQDDLDNEPIKESKKAKKSNKNKRKIEEVSVTEEEIIPSNKIIRSKKNIKGPKIFEKLPEAKNKKSAKQTEIVQIDSKSKIQVLSPKINSFSPKQILASPKSFASKSKSIHLTPLLLTPKSKRVSFSREDHVKEFSKSSRIKVVDIDMAKSPKTSALKRRHK